MCIRDRRLTLERNNRPITIGVLSVFGTLFIARGVWLLLP